MQDGCAAFKQALKERWGHIPSLGSLLLGVLSWGLRMRWALRALASVAARSSLVPLQAEPMLGAQHVHCCCFHAGP